MSGSCRWCRGPIPAGARSDALYCRKACRQGAFRARVGRSQLETTDRPMRLVYADPPYIGLSRRYYGDHPDFAGEVDHRALLNRLRAYDGWALSCSSASVIRIGALLQELQLDADLAVWLRRPAPHPTARVITSWEGLFYRPARDASRVAGASLLTDVLLEAPGARQRSTLPTSVVGMKPPVFLVWAFDLMGARPGDELDDLFPGSGMVSRTWAAWSGLDSTEPLPWAAEAAP